MAALRRRGAARRSSSARGAASLVAASRSACWCWRSPRARRGCRPAAAPCRRSSSSSAGASSALGAYAWLAAARQPDRSAHGGVRDCAVLVSVLSIADAPVPYLLAAPADALALADLRPPAARLPVRAAGGAAARAWSSAAGYATAIVGPARRAAVGDPAGRPRLRGLPAQPARGRDARRARRGRPRRPRTSPRVALALAAVVARRAPRAHARARRSAGRFAPLGRRGGGPPRARRRRRSAAQALDLDAERPAGGAARLHRRVRRAAGRVPRRARAQPLLPRRGRGRRDRAARRRARRAGVERALASALGDPTLAVAFWLPEQDDYVDRDGRPIALPAGGRRPGGDGDHASRPPRRRPRARRRARRGPRS